MARWSFSLAVTRRLAVTIRFLRSCRLSIGQCLECLVNGGNVGSVVGAIGLLWWGIVGGLLFTQEMDGGAGVVSLFGAGLGVVDSRSV